MRKWIDDLLQRIAERAADAAVIRLREEIDNISSRLESEIRNASDRLGVDKLRDTIERTQQIVEKIEKVVGRLPF